MRRSLESKARKVYVKGIKVATDKVIDLMIPPSEESEEKISDKSEKNADEFDE